MVHLNNTGGLNLNQSNTLRSPITDGYRVSNVPSSAITEGPEGVGNTGGGQRGQRASQRKLKTKEETADDGSGTNQEGLW